MKVRSLLLVMTVLFAIPATHAQTTPPKAPKPWQEKINVKGFLTEGGLANVIDGEARYLNRKKEVHSVKPRQEFESGDEIEV
ncbi:MAG TPA: hypothetical protein VF751_05535, partial [Chthoniobacterales bacterium]